MLGPQVLLGRTNSNRRFPFSKKERKNPIVGYGHNGILFWVWVVSWAVCGRLMDGPISITDFFMIWVKLLFIYYFYGHDIMLFAL
jgi:hypothetical protein